MSGYRAWHVHLRVSLMSENGADLGVNTINYSCFKRIWRLRWAGKDGVNFANYFLEWRLLISLRSKANNFCR